MVKRKKVKKLIETEEEETMEEIMEEIDTAIEVVADTKPIENSNIIEVIEEPPKKNVRRHCPDGTSYAGPQFYKCKYCGKRITQQELREGWCEE